MKLSQIQALVAVAEYGKFSDAALELDLSQPAISHAIATLEEELGVLLFARGRHGAVLTSAGERILHHARQILEHLDAIDKEANLHKGLHGGQVRIASFRSVATYLLPQAIAKFQRQYPEVAVTLIECQSYVDVEQCLREGKVDIGITYLPASDEFESWEILRDEYIALLPSTAKIKSDRLAWEDIATYPRVWLPALPCGRNLHEQLKTLAPQCQLLSTFKKTQLSLVWSNKDWVWQFWRVWQPNPFLVTLRSTVYPCRYTGFLALRLSPMLFTFRQCSLF